MTISNKRRYYLTLPDEDYKIMLKALADKRGESMNEYLMGRLTLLFALEKDPVGMAFITAFQNGGKDVPSS